MIIDENPQVRNERILERERLERVEQERIAREEQQRQQEEEAARQIELERQREESERERQALIEREELERQRLLELEREREQQELQEQRRRELAETERRRQEEAELRLQQEAAEAAAAQAARTEFELVQSATAIIQMAVQQVWNRPPSARNGMRAILQISMLPTGELLDVRITESSGDPPFDRSAENAVYGAAPFTELQSLPINVFNANFRTLSLIFQPEDLLN